MCMENFTGMDTKLWSLELHNFSTWKLLFYNYINMNVVRCLSLLTCLRFIAARAKVSRLTYMSIECHAWNNIASTVTHHSHLTRQTWLAAIINGALFSCCSSLVTAQRTEQFWACRPVCTGHWTDTSLVKQVAATKIRQKVIYKKNTDLKSQSINYKVVSQLITSWLNYP